MNGSLRADVEIGGTLKTPLFDLRAVVPDAGFRVPSLGIGVERAMLRANSVDERQIRLEGRATSGGGSIRLEGVWRPDVAAKPGGKPVPGCGYAGSPDLFVAGSQD